MNQPSAGYANYQVLVESVVPVIAAARGLDDSEDIKHHYMDRAAEIFQQSVDQVMRLKLGFASDQDVADELWRKLDPLMRLSRVDWTLLFRELTYLVKTQPSLLKKGIENITEVDSDLLKQLTDSQIDTCPFYEKLTLELYDQWLEWIGEWRTTLTSASQECNDGEVFERMRTANPKYILREWMLVKAYRDAAVGDDDQLKSLNELIQRPYDEGSDLQQQRFYKRAPDIALTSGGTGFMSCSS